MANEVTRRTNPLATITEHPPITVSGDSTFIGAVYDGVHFHLGAEELPLIQKMVGSDVRQSHVAEWAQLDTQRYNLFVLQDESYNSGSFSITEDDALKNTDPKLKKQFSSLGSELLRMPCIFATKNPDYKYAPNYLSAHVGKLTEIRPQGSHIKFCFEKYEKFKQQLINADIKRFGLRENELRNQLDEVHWGIVEGNLLEIIDELEIEIK